MGIFKRLFGKKNDESQIPQNSNNSNENIENKSDNPGTIVKTNRFSALLRRANKFLSKDEKSITDAHDSNKSEESRTASLVEKIKPQPKTTSHKGKRVAPEETKQI